MAQFYGGSFAQGLAQGLDTGSSIRARRDARKRENEKLKMAKEQQAIELEAAKEFGELLNGENAAAQSRQQGLKTMQDIGAVLQMPDSMRRPAAESLGKEIEQSYGSPPSDLFMQYIGRSKKEEVLPQFKMLMSNAATDMNFNKDVMGQLIQNPQALRQASAQASPAISQAQQQQSVSGPQPPKEFDTKFIQNNLATMQQRKERIQQLIAKYPNTDTAKALNNMVKTIDARMAKLEERLGPQSSIGRRNVDVSRGYATEADIARREKSSRAPSKNDILIPILNQVGEKGLESISANQWDQLDLLRTTEAIDITVNRRLRDVLMPGKPDASDKDVTSNLNKIKTALQKTKAKKVLALPGDKTNMVKGEIYSTPKGPAYWTGTGFKRIE